MSDSPPPKEPTAFDKAFQKEWDKQMEGFGGCAGQFAGCAWPVVAVIGGLFLVMIIFGVLIAACLATAPRP